MLYDIVLFDLDGTLIESGPGIFAATRAVLKDMGLSGPDDANIRKMVGPPLRHGLRDIVGVPEDRVEEAALRYIEKARTVGIDLIKPYDGVKEMLTRLKEHGIKRGIVTSKLTPVAKAHLDRLGLSEYIDYVRGAEEGANGANKEMLLTKAVSDMGISKQRIAMVGDRMFDLDAARAVGIDGIGVLYGYGDEEELSSCCPKYMVKTVDELCALLCGEQR